MKKSVILLCFLVMFLNGCTNYNTYIHEKSNIKSELNSNIEENIDNINQEEEIVSKEQNIPKKNIVSGEKEILKEDISRRKN